jgi:3-oxoacyl-(acyl-carrier-protein) synthase
VADADRIAIVTAGVVTPIGQDLDAFWSALVTGASGISRIERFPVDDLRVARAGEIKKLVRERGDEVLTDCRASRLLIAAADELVTHVGGRPLAPDPRRVALVLGTALGGVEEGERSLRGERRPSSLAGALYDSPARTLAEWLGAEGPLLTISTACASGATALGVAADLLRNGAADVAVAGGYDVLCRFVMKGFDVLRSLTRDEVRPFDRRRSGRGDTTRTTSRLTRPLAFRGSST